VDRGLAIMVILRSLLLGRGEWSPQLRQGQRFKGQPLRFTDASLLPENWSARHGSLSDMGVSRYTEPRRDP